MLHRYDVSKVCTGGATQPLIGDLPGTELTTPDALAHDAHTVIKAAERALHIVVWRGRVDHNNGGVRVVALDRADCVAENSARPP